MTNTIAALIIIIGAAFTNASAFDGDAKVKVIAGKEAGVYKLLFEAAENRDVNIRIKDENNKLLTTKRIANTNGFLQPLDFGSLPSGSYFVEVSSNEDAFEEVVRHEIATINGENIQVTTVENEKKVAFLTSLNLQGTLNLYFYDDNDELIYKEEIEAAALNQRLYDLSKIDSKNVLVSLTNGHKNILQKKFQF